MSLIRCRDCDHEMSSEAKQCPHCGAPAGAESSKQKQPVLVKKKRLFLASFLTIIGLLGVFYLLYRNYGVGKEQIDGLINWWHNLFQSHG